MQIKTGLRKILEFSGFYTIFQMLVGKKSTKYWILDNIWKIGKTDKVIDMGCGPGSKIDFLPKDVDYIGFDLSKEYINTAKKQYPEKVFLEGTAGSFLSNGYEKLKEADLVMCNGLLHHLEDNEVNEIFDLSKKILNSGGRLVCIEPVFLLHQKRVSKWLMNKDRGQNVRLEQEYKKLISKYFENYTTNIVTGFTKIPYVHIIIEAVKN